MRISIAGLISLRPVSCSCSVARVQSSARAASVTVGNGLRVKRSLIRRREFGGIGVMFSEFSVVGP